MNWKLIWFKIHDSSQVRLAKNLRFGSQKAIKGRKHDVSRYWKPDQVPHNFHKVTQNLKHFGNTFKSWRENVFEHVNKVRSQLAELIYNTTRNEHDDTLGEIMIRSNQSSVKGILWDRRWSTPSIGISPQICWLVYRNAFLIMKLSNPPSFRAIRALIASQSTFEI